MGPLRQCAHEHSGPISRAHRDCARLQTVTARPSNGTHSIRIMIMSGFYSRMAGGKTLNDGRKEEEVALVVVVLVAVELRLGGSIERAVDVRV